MVHLYNEFIYILNRVFTNAHVKLTTPWVKGEI